MGKIDRLVIPVTVTLPDHVNQFLKEKRLAEQKRHGERVEARQAEKEKSLSD